MPMLKACSASSEGVVASTGTSNFWIKLSDSPSFPRRLAAAFPSAFSTSCLVAASSCSLASASPLLQLNRVPSGPPPTSCDQHTIELLQATTTNVAIFAIGGMRDPTIVAAMRAGAGEFVERAADVDAL